MMKKPAVALLIGLFAAIVVGAIGYFMLVGPKKAAVDKKQKEIEAVENQIQDQKNTFQQLSDIKNRSAEFEAKVAALQSRLPVMPELPQLIRNIQAAADPVTGAGLPWLSFAPTEIETSPKGYSQYDFTMSVAGFYNEVTDLIYRMERMQRAIVIRNINMTPTTSILEQEYSANLGLVTCDIGARTFTFASPTGVAPAAAAPVTPQSTPSSAPASTPSE